RVTGRVPVAEVEELDPAISELDHLRDGERRTREILLGGRVLVQVDGCLVEHAVADDMVEMRVGVDDPLDRLVGHLTDVLAQLAGLLGGRPRVDQERAVCSDNQADVEVPFVVPANPATIPDPDPRSHGPDSTCCPEGLTQRAETPLNGSAAAL